MQAGSDLLLPTTRTFLWVLLPLLLLPLFLKLPSPAIQQWDEGRLAMNAVEMVKNGNLIVTYYNGEPEMWNTKPPLLIWLQAGLMQLIGFNEWAMRLPIALAALATGLLLFFFGSRPLGHPAIGFMGALALVTTNGYMDFHVTRTGDYDALLALWVTAYALSFFLYLHTGRSRYFWWFIACLTLAALTKSIAGLLVLPALVLYTLLTGKLGFVLRHKELYLGVAAFLFVTVGYYLLREQQNPGFLATVYKNELGGRYLETVEGHNYPWDYYLSSSAILPWMPLLPLFAFAAYKRGTPVQRHFMLFAVLFVVQFMLVISTAQTKLMWYAALAYPMAALAAGLGLWLLYGWLAEYLPILLYPAHGLVLLQAVFIWPYIHTVQQVFSVVQRDQSSETRYGYQMRKLRREHPEVKAYSVIRPEEYNASFEYYLHGYRADGFAVADKFPYNISDLQPGEVVLVCDEGLRNQVTERFETSLVSEKSPCQVLRVEAARQQ